MKLGTLALVWIGIGLVVAGIIGAVLAGQINCGYVAAADCYAAKMHSWQLALIPGLAGIGAIAAAMAANGPSRDEKPNTPDVP